jgi:Fe-S-cluster containining protein
VVDGPLRRWLKAVVRAAWTLEYGLRRRVKPAGYALAGSCGGCAKCCEQPAIHAGFATFRLRRLRQAFLAWQRAVNGFELVEADEDASQFVFRCTHFDWATRRCDSYASRPFMCRDYPRALLDQPWPQLFDGCGFRPLAKGAAAMLADLEARDIPEEKRRELAKRLYLE